MGDKIGIKKEEKKRESSVTKPWWKRSIRERLLRSWPAMLVTS